MNPLFALVEDLAALTVDELNSAITVAQEVAAAIAANPASFLVDGRTFDALKSEMTDGVAWIATARAELETRETAEVEEVEAEALADGQQEELDALAALALDEEEEGEVEEAAAEEVEEATAEVEEPAAEEAVTASAAKPKKLTRPARSRAATPPPVEEKRVSLTAAAEGLGYGLGQELPDVKSLASMMIRRRGQFGTVPEGTHGDRMPIARADWSDLYPQERRLTSEDLGSNWDKIEAVTASSDIWDRFNTRREKDAGSLTASGGLCAPVTNYYQLQMLSQANRPVRAALPSFNADRGGINNARPASLGSINDAVGLKTMEEDKAGGTSALKTCQVIDCPAFEETDIVVAYHCLQFGNVGARVFPELVAQWNSLVLAAHARMCETLLLDGISGNSTQVTASDLGLGASAALPSQLLALADGMRSRHRMDPNAVLRALMPNWVLDLLVSDMYRGQFERFDMTAQDFVRVLRTANIEPTFYIDSETGGGQVFGAQSASDLLSFPDQVISYVYPEGSFLYLDGGTLELGLVRDSILNSTNDYQIFGESFENVAFTGIESIALTSTVCDSGTVSLPASVTDCGDYS